MPRYRPCAVCGKPANWNPAQGSTNTPVHRACRTRIGGVPYKPGKMRRKWQCAQCGEFYAAPYKRKYCTKKCYADSMRAYAPGAARKAAARARHLSKLKTWDGVADAEIFARDEGVCQLGASCKYPGEPIDPEARHPQPLSPSVDHIIPLSYGGIDVAANKRAAHLNCNVGRNNRLTDEDRAFMKAHPEFILAPEQLATLPPRVKREFKPKVPKPEPVFYTLTCFWCGNAIQRTYRANFAICGECPGSTAGCSVCGVKMVIVAGSRPPETRKCRPCAHADPAPRPSTAKEGSGRPCGVCGEPLYSNNKIGICQRNAVCRRAYVLARTLR